MGDKNLKVLITGGSRGIGKAIAIEYARKGAIVLLLARDEEKLEEALESVMKAGGSGYLMKCDVTKPEDMQKAMDFAIQKMGAIDVAVLNAGIGGSGLIDGMRLEDFKRIFEVNLFGVIHGLAAIVPVMKMQGYGTIAGISSLAESRGLPGNAAYNSSKVALSHLLESARMELKHYGIRIVIVKPGFIQTDMTARHKFYMPFLMDADKAAKRIIHGIEKGKSIVAFPVPMAIASYIGKILPSSLFEFLFGLIKIRPEE
jgi:NAD(P)-dependent dehydrogenase (short-subunit alcohol dehydrogenase family)